MCIAAGRELQELLSTHNDLVAEVNTLRAQLGRPVSSAPRAPSTAFLAIMEVENAPCGDFPDGFGSASGSDEQILQGRGAGVEQEPLTAVSQAAGLTSSEDSSAQDFSLPITSSHSVSSTMDWQMYPQVAETTSAPSTLHALNTNWWTLSGLDCELPWEDFPSHTMALDDTCSHVLQGDLQNACVEPPSSWF